MSKISEDQIRAIGNVLKDETRPLKERFRALFTLKNIGDTLSIDLISDCFNDPSALLKHELAYCLGQMRDDHALAKLISVLEDQEEDAMVRHEAAEALGAIGSHTAIPYLEKFKNDPITEVAETCQLALERLNPSRCYGKKEDDLSLSLFNSIDPAPPIEDGTLHHLESIILNEKEPLFNRYKAMFALRNDGTSHAVSILGKALNYGSALFKHEVAFVLGQLRNKDSVQVLKKYLEDTNQHEMVRHECAEALGAIATDECKEILEKYLNDEKRVVRESCIIALDMCEYENSPEFQYANTLLTV